LQPTAHFGIIIGTAMLSYAKHGKFPALIQAAKAKSRRKKRSFRPNDIAVALFPNYSGSWDETDCKCAAPAPPRMEDKLERTGAGRGLAPAKEAAQNGLRSRHASPARECSPVRFSPQ